jgi:hypothetical protein
MIKLCNFIGSNNQNLHGQYQERDCRTWPYSGELYQYIARMLDRNGEDWWVRLHSGQSSSQRRAADQCALAHWFTENMGVSYICNPLEYIPQCYFNDTASDSTLADLFDEIEKQWNLESRKNQAGAELADFWLKFSKSHRRKIGAHENDIFICH